MTSNTFKKVLYVGFSCVDFVNVIDEFPKEDSDQLKMLDFYWQRGGNACNSSTVTTLLSVPCEYFGVLATQGMEARWIMDDFKQAGVCTDHCVMEDVKSSVSTNIVNITTGSRTILCCPRDYRYVSFADFDKTFGQDFSEFLWIHFELIPNSEDVLAMMRQVDTYNEKCRAKGRLPVVLSVEVEQPEITNTDPIMKLADFVFMSKDFARSRGSSSAQQAVKSLHSHCKEGATLICAWGDEGAALQRKDHTFTAPARTDVKVVDSLGAGDTFNAGFISFAVKTGRIHQLTLEDLNSAITFACQLAGYKCSIFGYSDLQSFPCTVKA